MKRESKLWWALPAVLLFCLLLSFRSSAVYAAGQIVASGTDGSNVTWSLDESGTLTLEGSGETAWHNRPSSFFGSGDTAEWYSYRDQITSIVVGEGITKLNSAAFIGLYNVTSVQLPSTLKELGQSAFLDCSSLAKIQLNEGLEKIGPDALCNTAIQSIEAPASLKEIAQSNFAAYRMTSGGTTHGIALANWKFSDAPDTNLKVVNNVLYSSAMDTILYCDPSVSGIFDMPNTVTTVKELAFEDCQNITGFNLSKNLKTVESYAFFWCNGVTELNIPDSITDAKYGAFGEMHGLQKVSIGTGIKEIPMLGFTRDYALTDVEFRGPITSIGEWAFEDCKSLEKIDLPQGLTTIEKQAFRNTALKEVTIPAGVTSVGEEAFPADTVVHYSNMVKMRDGSLMPPNQVTRLSYSVTFDQNGARSMLQIINDFRTGSDAWYWNSDNTTKTTASGLQVLQYDYSLEKAAMERASELALAFAHTRPDGSSCFTAINELAKNYSTVGENIAGGQPTAQSVMKSWEETDMDYNGQGHRRNMLSSDFNAIGIAHANIGGVDYWVQEFGYAEQPDTTYTDSDNSTHDVETIIKNSDFSDCGATITALANVLIQSAGGSVKVPSVTVDHLYANFCDWQIGTSVTAHPVWTSADNSIVEVQGDNIVGLKNGSAVLSGKVLGQDVSTTVYVGKRTGTWIQDATGRWYQNVDGSYPASQWKEIEGIWYYFNPNGYMARNQWVGNYYLGDNGAMAKNQWIGVYHVDANGRWDETAGWKQNSIGWWYLNSGGGYPQNEWKQIDGAWYYFDANGYMTTGWQYIKGSYYYMTVSGSMAANQWCNGYWLNADGTWTYQPRASWYRNAAGWYYQDTSGWYPRNCHQLIDGVWYWFNAGGYLE